jgi:hypothetical protein
MFEPLTLDTFFNRCCKDLLTFIGLKQLAIERGVEAPPVVLEWAGPPQQLIDSDRQQAPPSG